MFDSHPTPSSVLPGSPPMTSRRIAALLVSLSLAGCASAGAPPSKSGQIIATPVVTTTASGAAFVPVPLTPWPTGSSAQLAAAGPMAPVSGDSAAIDARFRQIDDHYSRAGAETRQLVKQAIVTMKQAPSAADVAALKATVTRLEAQVTRLTTATTRTEGSLTGLTSRIHSVERAQTERAAEQTAAATAPPGQAAAPLSVLPKSPPPDPIEAAFTEALDALNGPRGATEAMRRWLDLHPTHPKAAEGYFQLGFYYLNQHYPVAATHYLKRVISDYPMSLQASEAKMILSTISEPAVPAKKTAPKKTAKPARAAKPAKAAAKGIPPPTSPTDGPGDVTLPIRRAPDASPEASPKENNARIIPPLPIAPKPVPIGPHSAQPAGGSVAK